MVRHRKDYVWTCSSEWCILLVPPVFKRLHIIDLGHMRDPSRHKVVESGPLRFSNGDLYETFSAEKVTVHKGDSFG